MRQRHGCGPKRGAAYRQPWAPRLQAQMHVDMRIHASYWTWHRRAQSDGRYAHTQGWRLQHTANGRQCPRRRHCMGAKRQPQSLDTEKDPPARVGRRHAEGRLPAEPEYTACACQTVSFPQKPTPNIPNRQRAARIPQIMHARVTELNAPATLHCLFRAVPGLENTLGLCSRCRGAGTETPHISVPGRQVSAPETLTQRPRAKKKCAAPRPSPPSASRTTRTRWHRPETLTLHTRVCRRYEEMRSSTPIASFSCSYDTNAMAIEGTTLT